MIYFADLHIHSKYSRATSKECNLVDLAKWASYKGILVLGTGDFTHPDWSREIRELLEEAEDGLFRLKREYLPKAESFPGGFGPGDVRFLLNVEISSIYKKAGATRKVHNLVFMPDIASMEELNARLDRIGNIKSDGRPILGLDARDLLEIALEVTPESFLIPAHIWTPWFSLLGSRSGFDSVHECFADLSEHIFALETGLSSDPEMNHWVSALDRYTLVSNSDTHSPWNLGREANIFAGNPGYTAIREAIRAGGRGVCLVDTADSPLSSIRLESPDSKDVALHMGGARSAEPVLHSGGPGRFIGTIEFFPEEGKYHFDGHRNCDMRLDPEETGRLGGVCPLCGKPVTVGVMNRVLQLGDRSTGETPEGAAPFWRLIPLTEIISQALGVGPQSKKVKGLHMDLMGKLGPELMILWALSLEEIGRHAPKIIVEGISRVRQGNVHIQAGFDGEYGKVELFTPEERDLFSGQQSLVPGRTVTRKRRKNPSGIASKPKKGGSHSGSKCVERPVPQLNEEQLQAVSEMNRPVLVKAGPGTGKTGTLVHRAAALITGGHAAAEQITAVTFTRKAAGEMSARLEALVTGKASQRCWVGTFHQLGTRIIDHFVHEHAFQGRGRILDEDEALALFRDAVKSTNVDIHPSKVPSLLNRVSLLKQSLVEPDDLPKNLKNGGSSCFVEPAIPWKESPREDDELSAVYRAYEAQLQTAEAWDMDDLLRIPVQLLRGNQSEGLRLREQWTRHLLVDEFQDVNCAQYELVRLLVGRDGRGLFAIGDPDQAIYGFRGADRRFFLRFGEDFPLVHEVHLSRNYRSIRPILRASECVLGPTREAGGLEAQLMGDNFVRLVQLPNPVTEGIFITRTIDSMLGGSTFFSFDSGRVSGPDEKFGFADFAVLYRLNALGDTLEEAFRSSGIPYQRARKKSPKEEAESLDPRAQAVTLMTIHASKGLEFPVVFVAGCEETIIPHVPVGKSEPSAQELEEERRLLYVAMTRAGKDLFLTRASKRTLYGRDLSQKPSPFLESIDPSVCQFLNPLDGRRKEPGEQPVQYELFP